MANPAAKKRGGDSSRLKASPAEIAQVAVMRAGAQLMKAADSFYRSLGLTGAQYNILRILEGAEEPISQQQIARRLLVSRANVTSLIDRLEAKGFLDRCACPDRRVNLIQLTPKGFELLEKSFEEVTERSGRLMRRLSAEEQRELLGLLRKLEGQQE